MGAGSSRVMLPHNFVGVAEQLSHNSSSVFPYLDSQVSNIRASSSSLKGIRSLDCFSLRFRLSLTRRAGFRSSHSLLTANSKKDLRMVMFFVAVFGATSHAARNSRTSIGPH